MGLTIKIKQRLPILAEIPIHLTLKLSAMPEYLVRHRSILQPDCAYLPLKVPQPLSIFYILKLQFHLVYTSHMINVIITPGR
jgi:hypothetical protein